MENEKKTIMERIERLSPSEKARLMDFLDELLARKDDKPDLKDLSGSISEEEGKAMKRRIEEDCERIDRDEW